MTNNPLKIRQVHHIELYVGNAKQADYFYRNAFGFERVAYTGLETGNREQCSYALQQGTFKLLLTTPYDPMDKASGLRAMRLRQLPLPSRGQTQIAGQVSRLHCRSGTSSQ